jgi:hypothetical protein
MAMIAEDLIELMNNPKQVHNTREEIEKIPRDLKGPFEATIGEPAWGIHAIQGRSVRKFLAWNFLLVAIGITGAILWIVFVDPKDLQSAAVPYTALATIITVGMAMATQLGIA